jgi:2-polyprenyl-3-methyl-5-hydroxy-6-metoxy-1,4-benzoquinol methylase
MKKSLVEKHFDKIAADYDYYKNKNSFYYRNLKKLLANLIPRNMKILEIGCGTGELLISLRPKYGYGQDISGKMIKMSRSKYKTNENIKFSTNWPKGKFDYIFMSDVVEHLENPGETFSKIVSHMDKDTIFINTMANPLWESILLTAEKLGLKMPEGPHRRITNSELGIILKKTGLKIVKHDYKLLIPVDVPFLSKFANTHLEKYFKKLAFVEYFTAVKI